MDSVAHDHQLRALLKEHLSRRITRHDVLVDEFTLAFKEVRADIALVNGHLEGFEIKAEKDTLSRLPRQVEAYDKVFEYSWVVTTKSHLSAVRAVIPNSWGLLLADASRGAPLLRHVRMARRNGRRDASHLVRLLWRDEAMAKLEELGLSKGLKSKPKLELYPVLAGALALNELGDYVRHCLKARPDWRADAAPSGCGDSLRRAATK